jgi:hypothetical protein
VDLLGEEDGPVGAELFFYVVDAPGEFVNADLQGISRQLTRYTLPCYTLLALEVV